jgi:transcriptional regulator with XRE-family HTH domain
MVSKLKILRVVRDLSQDRLAELTGFSQSRVSRIERGVIQDGVRSSNKV